MIEVLKQMVEALEFFKELSLSMKEIEIAEEVIQAGKQAIAELESQEPWCMKMNGCTAKCEDCPDQPPLTPQRTWVGLTDEDWKEIEDMPDTFDQGVAWAQAKLKEKNT